jgi:hypothetical protein
LYLPRTEVKEGRRAGKLKEGEGEEKKKKHSLAQNFTTNNGGK